MRDTVILLSGGLDSSVLCASEQHRIGLALFVEYGQRAEREECAAAQQIARLCSYLAQPIELRYQRLSLPGMDAMNAGPGDGPRIVPARNLVLLAHAVSLAIATGHTRVIYGATDGDHASYADCRRDFVAGIGSVAQGLGVSVEAPLIGLDKRDVVALGRRVGATMSLSWSCYSPVFGQPCGRCNACLERTAALR